MVNEVYDFESFKDLMEKVRIAQIKFSTYTQEQVDKIFNSVAKKADSMRIPLAKLAVEETGMGVFEDKVIKNHFAAENIYNAYKNSITCGLVEEDKANGYKKFVEPVGVIGAIIPTTNPTSTAIFKILIALKTRNGIIISPHPRAKKSTIETAKILLKAAVEAGAPEDIIGWIDVPSIELTNEVMKNVNLILATGGTSMVKAAYSSGTPAIGVGPGNVPAVIDESADILQAVNSIIHSKTFDNGMICASEQSVIVLHSIYDEVKNEFKSRGCYFLNETEKEKIRKTMIRNGALNSKIVGQSAYHIAKLAEVSVPIDTKILIGEVCDTSHNEEFSREKLSPILAMYGVDTFDEAIDRAKELVENGGIGHTASLHINEEMEDEKINKFANAIKACRLLVNTPSSFGGIGDIYNFKLAPSLTLGCGSWGGNSISENVGIKHLLNTKVVAARRKNMLWSETPNKVYIKKGCLPFALEELKTPLGRKRVFIVTDEYLYHNGYLDEVVNKLNELNIEHTIFYNVMSDPTLDCAKEGKKEMENFNPDTIIALGGGSVLDAAKIMWVLYEHPDANFEDMAMRFMDIRKRIYTYPIMGEKVYFVAIPTSAGTGSEVTPFAVITDGESGIKYPLADYELMPNMAIVDSNLTMKSPKGLTAASGIDAAVHALEAYVSMMSSDYTDGLALKALKNVFGYLRRAYDGGENDIEAREKMADAATLAGMAFANAFLGVCHSMAHKLGAYFHLPHGIANALLISYVIKYNSSSIPRKMGTFPQYAYPHALERYAEISDFLGFGGNTLNEKVNRLIEEIEKLKEQIGIKKTIKEYGVDEEDFLNKLDEMSLNAFDDQCTGANPRYPLVEEIKDMYKKSYYGGEL